MRIIISIGEKMNLKAHFHNLFEWSKLSQLHNKKEEICRQFKISCPNKKKTRNLSITFDIISHVNTRRFFRSFFLYLCRCSHCPQAFRYNNNLWTSFEWCFCKNDYWEDIVVAVWYSFCPLQLPEKNLFYLLFKIYLSMCCFYFFAS